MKLGAPSRSLKSRRERGDAASLRRRRKNEAAGRGGLGRDLPDVVRGKEQHENDGGSQ